MNGFAAVSDLTVRIVQSLTAPPVPQVGLWLLAGVFLWSGVAKVRRPALAALAMVDFGIARRARLSLGLALGLAELALALALVVVPRPAAVVAAGLLWCFAVLIARSLQAGAHFACFCFGDADDHLSNRILARTTGLAILATATAYGAPLGTVLQDGSRTILSAVTAGAVLGGAAVAGAIPSVLSGGRATSNGG